MVVVTDQQKRWPLPQSTAGARRRGKLRGSEVVPGPWVFSLTALSHPASGHQRIAGLFSTKACQPKTQRRLKSISNSTTYFLLIIYYYLFLLNGMYYSEGDCVTLISTAALSVTGLKVSARRDQQNNPLLGVNLRFKGCKGAHTSDFKI